MQKTLLVLLCLSLVGCAQSAARNGNANQNLNVKTSPSPALTPTDTEKAATHKEADQEKQKAINDFIAKNYKDWQYKGISDNDNCDEFSSDPCDLLIQKGDAQKVVAVMFKRFTELDGKTRLVVFEARPIDLSQSKIKRIKQTIRENLDEDDCQSFIDDARSETDYPEPDNEPYHPYN